MIARKDATERSLTEWQSSSGKGYEVALLEFGDHAAEAMLSAASASQSLWTWLKRGGGVLLTWAGWALLFGPAQYLSSWIPLLSGVVGCVLSMIALGIALAHALTVIAVAWVAHRPLIAATLFTIAALSLS